MNLANTKAFYIVKSKSSGSVNQSGQVTSYCYVKRDSAEEQARALARAQPDSAFYVLELVFGAIAPSTNERVY